MKHSSGSGTCAAVFAALTIIGSCMSSILCCERQRVVHRKQLEDAVQNWEGEGGATVPFDDDDEPVFASR
jgi:hypothetical protein